VGTINQGWFADEDVIFSPTSASSGGNEEDTSMLYDLRISTPNPFGTERMASIKHYGG